jgi:hypothetical protein
VCSAGLPPADQPPLTADALLAGPRGRSLCVNLLDRRLSARDRRVAGAWPDALHYVRTGDTARAAEKLGAWVEMADLPGTLFDDSALMGGLQAAVDFAWYWQEPDAEDRGFASEAARAALRPVAEAVVAALAVPGVSWWTAPVDRGRQRYAQFLDPHPLPEPARAGAAESVAAWLADTLEDERSSHGRPEDPAAPYSGRWWSTPAHSRLPVTTRALPALGAVRLALVEDGLGWQSARCWPAVPDDGARVYEIRGPRQWAELADRYPLDVSKSRRHDWWRVTGWSGRWLIPDYPAVAADWDAVHVTVAGYLTTAGIAIPAGDGARTMLAGWDPDATWWLNDVLSFTSPPEDWRREDEAPLGWIRA